MSAERWEEVSDALAEAQALEPSERRTYLDEMDPHVRGEVEALLPHAAKAESEGFLKDPPWIVDDIPLVLEDLNDRLSELTHDHRAAAYLVKKLALGRASRAHAPTPAWCTGKSLPGRSGKPGRRF